MRENRAPQRTSWAERGPRDPHNAALRPTAVDCESVMLLAALHNIRTWYWTRRYRAGQTFARFVAIDVRRDVEVVDASRAGTGVLTVRTRTWNVLYAIKGIRPRPSFGDVREVAIVDLWKWSGQPWGGPVPASTDRGE